jgi:ABC-type Mn2+/Zn2+ transport system ATPase subunit
MNVDPRLVCVVGPNAAGKSSFIAALQHLDDDAKFKLVERTRGITTNDVTYVMARFALEAEDREVLSSIPEAASATHALLWKRHDTEGRGLSLEPLPERDLSPRKKARDRLNKLSSDNWAKNLVARADAEGYEAALSLKDAIEEVLTALEK